MSEILRTNEILSKGYGVSPKLVMIDENLSIEALKQRQYTLIFHLFVEVVILRFRKFQQ